MLARALASLGDRLRARPRKTIAAAGSRLAAVLVPLLGSRADPELLLFERSAHVFEHKGEICFPGGSCEPADRGPVEAALREAHEELGLSSELVWVIGLLDDVETTVSNYTITPVVAYVPGSPALVPDSLEVARIIKVPLARLLAPGVESSEEAEYQGMRKVRYAYTFDGNRVWGATARIVHSLVELLREA